VASCPCPNDPRAVNRQKTPTTVTVISTAGNGPHLKSGVHPRFVHPVDPQSQNLPLRLNVKVPGTNCSGIAGQRPHGQQRIRRKLGATVRRLRVQVTRFRPEADESLKQVTYATQPGNRTDRGNG
jgi:hypothetical protein